MLAARVLIEQGCQVRLLTFVTPFFGAEKALVSAQAIGLTARAVDLTEPHLEMMKNPKHGFGRFMNPCIDCHALMYRKAGEIMTAEGGDFLFSGEVLGQRPKSQNRRALEIVAHLSGYHEYILRPLSAKALPPTKTEEGGLVDRQRLLGLSGRTRKPQIALAREYGITDYPAPAGGCLLTDPIFSRRLKELYEFNPLPKPRDIELLKLGRHFRLPGGGKLIVGRNQADNQALSGLSGPHDLTLRVTGFPGPTTLWPDGSSDPPPEAEEINLGAAITLAYSDAPEDQVSPVRLFNGGPEKQLQAKPLPKEEFSHLMV